MAYHRSGLRRDVCVLLGGADGAVRGQELKRRLGERYGRLTPSKFHGLMDALEDAGHVAAEPDGLHDAYSLTDAGETALEEHYDWLQRQLA